MVYIGVDLHRKRSDSPPSTGKPLFNRSTASRSDQLLRVFGDPHISQLDPWSGTCGLLLVSGMFRSR